MKTYSVSITITCGGKFAGGVRKRVKAATRWQAVSKVVNSTIRAVPPDAAIKIKVK